MNIQTKKKGFSIGEVILASFVLTVGLISIAALAAASYRQSLESRDMIIATGLAQEGVELVRNIRDNNVATNPSTPFAGFPAAATPHCRRGYNDVATAMLDCSTAANSAFNNPDRYALEYTGGFYRQAGAGVQGRFRRYIYVSTDRNCLGIADVGSTCVRSFVFLDPSLYKPPVTGIASGCTAANKCAYTEVVLTDWK